MKFFDKGIKKNLFLRNFPQKVFNRFWLIDILIPYYLSNL